MEMEMEMEHDHLGLHLLPSDIAADILCRLPNIDSILRCKLVSKNWCALINDPVFLDTHTNRFLKQLDDDHLHCYYSNSNNSFIHQGDRTPPYRIFHYGEFRHLGFQVYNKARNFINIGQHIHESYYLPFMAGSCNGLICLCSIGPYHYHTSTSHDHDHDHYSTSTTYRGWFYVSNPLTREYLHIPIEDMYTFNGIMNIKSCAMATGFGYHTSTKEYKIVRVAYVDDDVKGSMVHVYTLGSGRWRSKGAINHLLSEINHSLTRKKDQIMCSYEIRNSIGICLNGALYWLNEKKEIISFDLADEEFRIVPVTRPSSCFNNKPGGHRRIGHVVLGSYLCLTQHNLNLRITKIWVMNLMMNKEKKKEEYSWIEKFTIKWGTCDIFSATPFAILNNGNILFHSKGCNYIISYDPKTEHFTPGNEVFVDRGRYSRVFPYMKSFVSLKALQEKDAMARKLNTAEE